MASCDLLDSCFFFNKQELDMPHLTRHMRRVYCIGDCSSECVLHRISETCGVDNVPKYLYPNDMFEILHMTQPQSSQQQGGSEIMIKVIYSNGSQGMVRDSNLGRLLRLGRIAAYQPFDTWVEVRRKQKNKDYLGPERRTSGGFIGG
jgi:hypothetical protein